MNYEKLALMYEKKREVDRLRREIDAEREAEIASLREAIRRLADQDATLSVQGGDVIVTIGPTLTGAEREAVEWYASCGRGNHADTLRGLLARLPETSTPPDARR